MVKKSSIHHKASIFISPTSKKQVINLDDEKLLLASAATLTDTFKQIQSANTLALKNLTAFSATHTMAATLADAFTTKLISQIDTQRFSTLNSLTEQIKALSNATRLSITYNPTDELKRILDANCKALAEAYQLPSIINLLSSIENVATSISNLATAPLLHQDKWLENLFFQKNKIDPYYQPYQHTSTTLVYPAVPETITPIHFEAISLAVDELKNLVHKNIQKDENTEQRITTLGIKVDTIISYLQALPNVEIYCKTCTTLLARVEYIIVGKVKCAKCGALRKIPSDEVIQKPILRPTI